LKVWLALQQVGREGYMRMIADDMELSRVMFARVAHYPELEALTQGLSITTFRFVPSDLRRGDESDEAYLNDLNRELLTRLQQGGEV
jgi:aromatic-L-amino-acid decarboxylase